MEHVSNGGVQRRMRTRTAFLFTLGPAQFLLLGFVLTMLAGLVGLLFVLLLG